MMHMPSSGSNGCILYCGEPFRAKPWATAIPEPDRGVFERELFSGVPKKMREFALYLPSYKALQKLELGFSAGAKIAAPSAPSIARPVVFYGTSITQGGCANTAGTDFVSTIGRQLNLDVINLGFSGNGKGEPELAELVSEIDASLYVLDYAGNVNTQELQQTLPPFLHILRKKRPTQPILIVTNVCFSLYDWKLENRAALENRRDVMMSAYLDARRAGDSNIHLADGFGLIPYGTDGAYVDGIHPTDLGFAMMAERLAPVIRMILERDHG
jgi:lysophospholipase L1-like esterase